MLHKLNIKTSKSRHEAKFANSCDSRPMKDGLNKYGHSSESMTVNITTAVSRKTVMIAVMSKSG